MKFGFRTPSLKKRIAARTSPKRLIQNSLGLKAPKGMGWLTNPQKAAYNKVYNKTTKGCLSVLVIPIILGSLISLLVCCSSPATKPDINYQITKNYLDKGLSRYTIRVTIDQVLNELDVKKIAEYIKATNTDAENFIIFFHLKGFENGAAWARVDYPNYKLEIIGTSKTQGNSLDNPLLTDLKNIEVIGKWKDLTSFSERTLIIYKSESKYFIRWYYKDNSFDDVDIQKKQNKYKVVNKNNYDEWYVVEQNGNLGTYSSKGKFSEAIPLK